MTQESEKYVEERLPLPPRPWSLAQEVETLKEILRDVEWFGEQIGERPFCPECGNYKSYGHRQLCRIGWALMEEMDDE